MAPDGTRRSGRIPKQVAISLFGSDVEGRVFSEQTKTVVLSRHGAGIVSTYKLSAEQELVVRSEASHKEIEARVVGQIGSDDDLYIYGIAFLDRDINFWDVDFPDLSETEKLASRTPLECSSCRSRELADHSDLASDVMAVNKSIMRYCRKCGLSTLWKRAAPGSAPSDALGDSAGISSMAEPRSLPATPTRMGTREQTSSFAGAAWTENEPETSEPAGTREAWTSGISSNRNAGILPAAKSANVAQPESPSAAASAGAAVRERENRRKHVRTRVNLKACVRRPGLPDDVVACEDMSRGGLRFKSNRKYFEKMLVEIAAPYSPGDQAIFVSAQIAYVQELPEQNMYRYGVMYLRSGKK